MSIGVSFLKEGKDTLAGVTGVVCGFGLIVATVILAEKGIIQKLAGGKAE